MAIAVKPETRGQDSAPGPTIQAAVAARRSLMVDGMLQGPGTVVELPAAEARRLMSLGFLFDHRMPAVAVQANPNLKGAVNGVVKLA